MLQLVLSRVIVKEWIRWMVLTTVPSRLKPYAFHLYTFPHQKRNGPTSSIFRRNQINEPNSCNCLFTEAICALFRIFSPSSPHPPPPAFTRSSSNALHYACDGLCGSNEARKCNKGLIEDTGGKLFNFKESEAN